MLSIKKYISLFQIQYFVHFFAKIINRTKKNCPIYSVNENSKGLDKLVLFVCIYDFTRSRKKKIF